MAKISAMIDTTFANDICRLFQLIQPPDGKKPGGSVAAGLSCLALEPDEEAAVLRRGRVAVHNPDTSVVMARGTVAQILAAVDGDARDEVAVGGRSIGVVERHKRAGRPEVDVEAV